MTNIKKLIGTVVAAGALLGAGSLPAAAAPLEPFTITETIDFEAGAATFEATGALCPSGTFEDQVVTGGGHPDTSGRANILIETVYTCDDGSGTFFARKHVFISIVGDDSSTNSGPITFHGGTGSYANLSGHGVDVGTAAGGTGVGEISGVLKLR
jgi:hypothetical protein